MPLKLVTTQKYESLAWETVMAPAAMAMTTSALATGVSKPNAGIIGKTIADVVVSATVEEPCAVFRAAETRKGKNSPMTDNCAALLSMKVTRSVAAMTRASTPPP